MHITTKQTSLWSVSDHQPSLPQKVGPYTLDGAAPRLVTKQRSAIVITATTPEENGRVTKRKKVAVKIFLKSEAKEERARREIEMTRSLAHPNIIKVLGVEEDSSFLYMVMEHVQIDLFEFVERGKHKFSLKKIFFEVLEAVHYLHSNLIVHGDIKLENVLVDERTGHIRLIDFGMAVTLPSRKSKIYGLRGSPGYVAPEIWLSSLTKKGYEGFPTDIYSLGVLLFALEFGLMPFLDDDGVTYYRAVGEGMNLPPFDKSRRPDLFFPKKCNHSLQELLKMMLALDPKKRIGLEGVLLSNWFLGVRFLKKIQVVTRF